MESVNDSPDSADEIIEMAQNSESSCPVIDANTGNVCGEKNGLEILNEFRQFYEERIQNIDGNSENGVQEKMNVMMEWIKDLNAQNAMLVSIVEELEEAACFRVKMLEEKLKHTSSSLTDNMSQYINPSKVIVNDIDKRINQLEKKESDVNIKVAHLESDIRGLLELIRRAGQENRWRLDGITFYKIKRRDIPIPDQSTYAQAMGDNKNIDILSQQLQLLIENEKKSTEYQDELQEKVTYLSEKLQNKEEMIQKLMGKLESVKSSLKKQTEANSEFNYDDMVKSDMITVKNSGEDIHEEFNNQDGTQHFQKLHHELEEKMREITRLTHQLNKLEKESLESREALTLEVAEKHDTAMNFKQQVMKLEEVCRQLQMQINYKETIIREMRTQIKQLKAKVVTVCTSSPNKNHTNTTPTLQRVTWSDNVSDNTLERMKSKNDNLLAALLELKTILMNDHCILKEKIQELHDVWYHTTLMEKDAYDKYLTAGHSKVVDILEVMEKLRNRVSDNGDQGTLTTNGAFLCTDKLMKIIDALSDLYINKNKRLLDLEYVLQDVSDKNDEICEELSEKKNNIRENIPDITREQFNEMEEFRVCTVEAQAATEDLREEIDVVMCNLKCRNQLFIDLCNSIEKIRDVIARTKQNISTVINSVKAHVDKKILDKNTIKLRNEKLKDMKNEINNERLKCCSSINCREHDIYNGSFDNIIDEVEYVVHNLDEFIDKEDNNLKLLEQLRDNMNNVDENLEKMQRDTDHVLQKNEVGQNIINEKTKRLDKLEQELDCAHTKMLDTLENIVLINQQKECSNDHSCSTDDTSPRNKNDENSLSSTIEIDQLKISLCSKDKLLKHKDEIIRIQKDSMEMTQDEYKDLRQRLQSRIDAKTALINQCVQEKMKLLEQNQLQNQTIKHLQDAVVEAKKNLNRQLPQKSAMDFGISDGWNPITPSVFNNGNVHDV